MAVPPQAVRPVGLANASHIPRGEQVSHIAFKHRFEGFLVQHAGSVYLEPIRAADHVPRHGQTGIELVIFTFIPFALRKGYVKHARPVTAPEPGARPFTAHCTQQQDTRRACARTSELMTPGRVRLKAGVRPLGGASLLALASRRSASACIRARASHQEQGYIINF